METTVPEVARHDTSQTRIDQHRPAGNASFPAFGMPEPTPVEAMVSADTGPSAPTEAESDQLVTDIKFLNTELATTEKNLRVALAATLREHAQLLDLFAAQEQSTLVLERGESALAQDVLIAQHRVRNQAAKAELLGRQL
jgi:hypothetical protein